MYNKRIQSNIYCNQNYESGYAESQKKHNALYFEGVAN